MMPCDVRALWWKGCLVHCDLLTSQLVQSITLQHQPHMYIIWYWIRRPQLCNFMHCVDLKTPPPPPPISPCSSSSCSPPPSASLAPFPPLLFLFLLDGLLPRSDSTAASAAFLYCEQWPAAGPANHPSSSTWASQSRRSLPLYKSVVWLGVGLLHTIHCCCCSWLWEAFSSNSTNPLHSPQYQVSSSLVCF